jgi:hypothetical protein
LPHLLKEAFKYSVFICFDLDFDVVEVKIVPDDFQKKMGIRFYNGIDRRKALLRQTPNNAIIPVIEGRPFKQAVKLRDKLGSQGSGKMFLILLDLNL